MLIRNCAGGVVFSGDRVFLLRNDRGEWTLPRAIVRNGDLTNEVALRRVQEESGAEVEIISTAGHTNYEFFSVSHQKPICNKITWYIMKSLDERTKSYEKEKPSDRGFFRVEEAMELVAYSQDKALLNLSFSKLNAAVV